MATPKDNDQCHSLHWLTVEVAVIQEHLRGNKEALALASDQLEGKLREYSLHTFALQSDLDKLRNEVENIKIKFVTRELHDKVAEEIDELRQNLSNWQGRLLMIAWLITAIAAVATISVSAYHLFGQAVH